MNGWGRTAHRLAEIRGDGYDPCIMNARIPVIEARGLTKRYGELTAVDAIDFEVGAGACVGFLGPNGAGKTTTVKMVSCFSPVSAGTVRVFGHDVMTHPREVKSNLGICPQEDNLDPDFTVEKNLTVYARYYGTPRGEVRPFRKHLHHRSPQVRSVHI